MPEISDSELMSRFISMGSNCEFGTVQSLCHVASLDLLRWAGTEIGTVIRLLEDRFEHIADPACLSVSVYRGEYFVENSRYGFKWHSWVKEGDITPERLLKRETGRLRRQAEILLDDLAEGTRILLRKALNDNEAASLDDFVRVVEGYGPCRILFVSRSEQKARVIERASERLMLGYLEETETMPPHEQVAAWLPLCRQALAMVEQGK